jgi:hypothetical protein
MLIGVGFSHPKSPSLYLRVAHYSSHWQWEVCSERCIHPWGLCWGYYSGGTTSPHCHCWRRRGVLCCSSWLVCRGWWGWRMRLRESSHTARVLIQQRASHRPRGRTLPRIEQHTGSSIIRFNRKCNICMQRKILHRLQCKQDSDPYPDLFCCLTLKNIDSKSNNYI